MTFNKTFATILTFALTTGINVAAFASPINVETMKENRIATTENDNKSDKNTKPSQEGSQGNKCSYSNPWC